MSGHEVEQLCREQRIDGPPLLCGNSLQCSDLETRKEDGQLRQAREFRDRLGDIGAERLFDCGQDFDRAALRRLSG